jgi:hypothetical protein|nr:MAG TPA: hypothetical protein [Caudoviricetes sp.]
MFSKKLTTMKEPLEMDLQLVATELDTSVTFMRYLSDTIMEDGLSIDAFRRLWDNIKETAPEISSIDDNTVLVEYAEEAIILHETLENKYIIFDAEVTCIIEKSFNSYKELN